MLCEFLTSLLTGKTNQDALFTASTVPGLGFFWPKHKEPLVLVMLGIEALHSVAGLRGLLLGRNHMFGVWLTASDDKICYKQFVEAC